MQSKAGQYFLAHEFAARQKSTSITPVSSDHTAHTQSNSNPEGVQHISLNPGFTNTSIQRRMPAPVRGAMSAVSKGLEYGAYTELHAGLAPDVGNDGFVILWGRKGCVPAHIVWRG
jgi:retinol dehydrogenase-12